jgi:sarcosine oxidase/L-pipecolate oxidase
MRTDNMFVLDFVPEQYLAGGVKNSVAVFTAGWAMKFVPLLGRALKEMILDGKSDFARPEFAMTRTDSQGRGIIVDGPVALGRVEGKVPVPP